MNNFKHRVLRIEPNSTAVQKCANKADSYGNEKLIRKWNKSVFFIRHQKFGQVDSYGNEKLIRKWTKSTGLGAF